MDKFSIGDWVRTYVPFAALAVQHTSEEVRQRPLTVRLSESLIIALVSGVASAYLTLHTAQAIQGTQLEDLKEEVAQQHHDTVTQLNNLQLQLNELHPYIIQPGPGPRGS